MNINNYVFVAVLNVSGLLISFYTFFNNQELYLVEFIHFFLSVGCYSYNILIFLVLNIIKNDLNLLYWTGAINISYIFCSLPTLVFDIKGLLCAIVGIINSILVLLMVWKKEGYDYTIKEDS